MAESDTDGGLAQRSRSDGPQSGEPKSPASAAIAEQLARIERVIWSTPVAAAVEPWVTPRWMPAHGKRATGEADSE